MLKSAIKSYYFVSSDFMSRPFCSHVAMLQHGASSGVLFCKQTGVAACRFQNECNQLKIALLVWIKLVITNRTPVSRSRDFVITRLISDQIHSTHCNYHYLALLITDFCIVITDLVLHMIVFVGLKKICWFVHAVYLFYILDLSTV